MAFLYEPDLRDELDAGRLVRIPLEGGELELETAIVLLPDGARNPAVRAFLQVLEESATAGWSVLPDSGGVSHAIH
jgi:DNA-binding transcriptional LysR family regulator